MVKLISSEALVFDYPGPLRAIDGIELTADAGELIAVLGPNGAGKSSLLKLLAGLLQPTSGIVRLAGGSVAELTSRERARRIAIVPQTVETLPDVSVESFVAYGRYAHQGLMRRPSTRDEDIVASALRDADARDLASRPLSELSGGQRQRALIARALAQEADLLLVDEPTNALDPEHQVRVFELLGRLTSAGRCAFVATHELNLASQFATRILLLDGGRLCADGVVEEVLTPGVLEPVYGPNLRYGKLPLPSGIGERPFIVPWLNEPTDY